MRSVWFDFVKIRDSAFDFQIVQGLMKTIVTKSFSNEFNLYIKLRFITNHEILMLKKLDWIKFLFCWTGILMDILTRTSVFFMHTSERKHELLQQTKTSTKGKEELVSLSSVNLRASWTLSRKVKNKPASIGLLRGIALTFIAAKIYNPLLRNRIEPKIDNILRKNQNGFRRNRSTTSQILTIRRILEGVRAKNIQATLLFVDFTKAFDSIHREKME